MKKILILMVGLLFIGVNVFAQGDLIVNGKLGIGTTSPVKKFELLGARGLFSSDAEAMNLQRSADTSPITGFLFEIYKSRGSVGSETNVLGNDVIGQYDFYYHDSVPVLGARWGAAMDNSTTATKFFFENADRAHFKLDVNIDGSLTLDNGGVTCIMMRDTDDAGWTECNSLDGALTCSVDADGICDGS